MKRYEFTDSYDNNIRVQEPSSPMDGKKVWLFLDGKRFENNEFKLVSLASCLTINQAKILISSLQDMIETLERK